MNKRRIAITVVLTAALGGLVYSQVRTWRHFDWTHFWEQTRGVNPLLLLGAVCAIYLTYVLRAIRWKVFLRPVANLSWRRLVAPTIIGFTGLALLGRPGEFMRPYLIARKEGLTVTSQLGVWTVERIFDLGAFTILLALDILISRQLHQLQYFGSIHAAGYALIALTLGLAAFAIVMWRWGVTIADALCRLVTPISQAAGHQIGHKLRHFSIGLHTIRDARSFLEALGLSLLIWFVIALSYLSVTRAYPPAHDAQVRAAHHVLPSQMQISHIFPLLASSMAGSIVQLPAVGGGSQLAVISVLVWVYQVPNELAVSCGILLWLVTFMACVPVGLVLARREHVSLRKLPEEEREEERREETQEMNRRRQQIAP